MSCLNRPRRGLLAFVALALAAACSDSTTGIELVTTPCTFSFAYDTTTMTKTASGLFYRDIAVGSGAELATGQDTYVHYTGWLTSGSKFDANIPGDVPLNFPVGVGAVIKGFDEGVKSMRIGGCRRLVIPPSLGYGATANGPIPANSILVFEVGVVGAR